MIAAPQLRTGCDVVEIARLGAAIRRRAGLLERLFTERELDDVRRGDVAVDSEVGLARLAARFAAKEAVRKAVGDMRLPFHDVEVRSRPDGAPELWLRGRRDELSCSMSHDGGVALAVVVGLTLHGAGTPEPAPDDLPT